MASQAVQIQRETIQACMTCPLCHNLFNEATTISLCLHTFCRKCIYEKLSDEEVDSCPICNIDLGCLPVEKLRPDNNVQDIRSKIFPFRRRKIKVPEIVPSTSLPAKRKERSLSSLVVSAPKVSKQTGTGERTKTGPRKASSLHRCNFGLEENIKKEETYAEDNPDSFMSEPSKKYRPNEDTENNAELTEGKVDLWTPLNCLVEAANRTKSSKSNSLGTSLTKVECPTTPLGGLDMPEITTTSESVSAMKNELQMPKTKNVDNGHTKKHGNDKDLDLPSESVKRPLKRRRKPNPDGQKSAPAASEKYASAQVMLDATGGRCSRKSSPIWFSLVASEDQKADVPLPQISACYVRIKDGTVPVLLIQKYLVKKLNLASESEVEIMCRGQPVVPTLELHKLVDMWFRTASTSKKIPAFVGSSAKDFVMVLSYCRKPLASAA